MWENILVLIIIAACLFFVGRRFFRQFKSAAGKDGAVDCNGDCSCCSSGKGLKR